MKVYHGTDRDFEKLDINQTSEFGIYFADDLKVAQAYGRNIHEIELSFNTHCDLRTESGIRTALETLPALKEVIEEEIGEENLTISELIEDEFEMCLSVIQDSSLNIKPGLSVRDELLKKLSGRYEAVILRDCTDGDEHNAYAIFDNKNFKYTE